MHTMKFKAFHLFLLVSPSLTPPVVAQQYHSPVGYCRAAGTIDKPDARYVGPKLPVWMAKELNLTSREDQMMEWRCAEGKVLAVCTAQINTSRTPTQPLLKYCEKNPSSTVVPMVVTGHNTTVSWACTKGQPDVIGSGDVDKQGYATAFWKVVGP